MLGNPPQRKVTPKNAALGIDLGSGVTKVVAVSQTAGRIDIHSVGAFPLPQGHVQNSVVVEVAKFGRALAEYIAQAAIAPAPACISIPSSAAVLRWVTLPLLVGDELREAAKFKVKRHLPFPVESAYVEVSVPHIHDAHAPPQDEPVQGHADQAECLVIAVPRTIVDSRAEAIEAAGIEPVGAELEAQAILRIVERRLRDQSPLWRDASLTIIDVGAVYTHMYVVQNQRLQFLRGVRFGSDAFAHAVAKELDIPLHEAHEIVADPSTELAPDGILHIHYDALPAAVNVAEELQKLIREFLRLLRYFRSLHPERSYAGILDSVILCGGLGGMKGFAENLEASLELRVERATPLAGTIAKFTKESFESVAARQEAYAVALGLALGGLQRGDTQRRQHSARSEYTWSRAAA